MVDQRGIRLQQPAGGAHIVAPREAQSLAAVAVCGALGITLGTSRDAPSNV